MNSIGTRLAAVRARIDAACTRAGRPAGSAELIAVSKLHPAECVRDCYSAGHRDFGENYAQELRDKAGQLSALADLRWHAIGPLQINKARYVARYAHAFHALDRMEVARELARRREGEPLRCYVEINIAGERSKTGANIGDAEELVQSVRELNQIDVVGLMCLPPLAARPEESRSHFRALRELAETLGLKGLSMGTTSDFEVAIEEGATVVRVGTAIFGERRP